MRILKEEFFRDFNILTSNPIALPMFDLSYRKTLKTINRLALPRSLFAIEIQRQSL